MLNVSEVMQPGADPEQLRRQDREPRAERPGADLAGAICIHHGGRAFVASPEQAGIFLRRAQDIASKHLAELVPLLHSAGVDLLFVTARTPLQVHDSRDRSFTRGHLGNPAA